MKYWINAIFFLLLISTVSAEPLYQSKSDFLESKVYRDKVELERPTAKLKQTNALKSTSVASAPDIEVTFTSASPWLSGVNHGASSFGGSLGSGQNFFGSSLTDADLIPVQIIFSNSDSTLCQTFRRDLGYASNGVGVFPGTAWDMSDPGTPRRLNLCFVEASSMATPNLIWDPSTNLGKREYVFIMQSSYDGTGMTYAGDNAFSGASSMDILFAYWPDITTGYTLLETLPATLDIGIFQIKNARVIPDSTENRFTWKYKDADPDHFNLYAGTSDPPPFLMTIAGSDRSFTHSSLANSTEYFYFTEAATSSDSVIATSKIVSGITQKPYNEMNLLGYLHEYNKYGDIWGYTDNGIEYALICVRDEGVSIIDITATPPVEVGFITPSTQGVDSKDIKIYQNYAVLINEGDDVQIYDLTDITNPTLTGTFTPDGGGAHNCIIEGDYMYLIGNHGTGGLEIVDISNPAFPVEVGEFQPFYYHDIDIRNDTICATGIYGDGIDLIDVSNKALPILISRFNYTGSGAHNAEFTSDGSHVFIGDEIGSSGNHLRTFDISDPMNVSLVSELDIDTISVVHNCYVIQDTLLVIAHYTLGVRIWNIVDPANPFEVAHYDTFLKDEYSYQGCWSVYPYFAPGKIIASDMQSGLFVLETNFATSSSCCLNTRGNVDSDVGDNVDISDLVFIVDFIFTGGTAPLCTEEANVDGDAGENIDISDLVFIVDFIFTGGLAPSACP